MEKEKPQLRYWQAYITAYSETYKRDVNQTVGVVAADMLSVMKQVAEAYPDAVFWTIQHRGKVNLPVIHTEDHSHDEDKAGNIYQDVS